jgi:RecA-family ATPase
MSLPTEDDLSAAFRPVNQTHARPVDWLWPCRLALGKLALLDGDPGLGKTFVALDLCARLSTGRQWPDGSASTGPAAAIYLGAEDDLDDTIRPRLEALGADLGRVLTYAPQDLSARGPLRLSIAVKALDRVLAQTTARLVVLDPIMAFLDEHVRMNSDQSVRRALLPLAQLAARHQCAVLMNRHLNKAPGQKALYRGGGSIGFIAACRSAWLVAADPGTPGPCVLAQLKNNVAAPQPSLAYQVHQPEGAPATLTWLGPSAWTANELLLGRLPQTMSRDQPRDLAADFLLDLLADGPRTSRHVWAAAQAQGITRRTLQRAKQQLEVRSVRFWAEGQRVSFWLLKGQSLPPGFAPDAGVAEVDAYFHELQERYPPPSPFDEE